MPDQVLDDLLKIGEFAAVSDVPARTLRYYDRIRLFRPIHVDPSTGYRYYSRDQLPRINCILALKDLGLSLEQIDSLLADDLPAPELRGMLRLKQIEIQNRLNADRAQLDGVEERLRQIETARLKSRREGVEPMRSCPNCGRRTHDEEGDFCPYCGKPLDPGQAYLSPVGKPAKELAARSLILVLGATVLIVLVAALVTILTYGRGATELLPRPLPTSSAAQAELALLWVRYEESTGKGSLVFEGQVENLSDHALERIVVIVSLYDADPDLISTSRRSLACGPLPPGSTCGFWIEVDASPEARYYGVIFQQASGSTIQVRDDRSR